MSSASAVCACLTFDTSKTRGLVRSAGKVKVTFQYNTLFDKHLVTYSFLRTPADVASSPIYPVGKCDSRCFQLAHAFCVFAVFDKQNLREHC